QLAHERDRSVAGRAHVDSNHDAERTIPAGPLADALLVPAHDEYWAISQPLGALGDAADEPAPGRAPAVTPEHDEARFDLSRAGGQRFVADATQERPFDGYAMRAQRCSRFIEGAFGGLTESLLESARVGPYLDEVAGRRL